MNQDGSWNQMVQDQESDLTDFLNAGDFSIEGLDFGDFDAASAQDGEIPNTRPEVTAATSGLESFMGVAEMPVLENGWDPLQTQGGMETADMARAKAEQMRFHQQQQQAQMQQHQHGQSQPPHQQQHYGHMHGHMPVPPTPDSMEMHGHSTYPGMNPHQARVMYENYPRKQEQMVFTPLVSPAVTPLDTQFQIEYAVPGEYFSPLTSPAMPAQVQQRSVYSSTSEGASPSDMEIDSPNANSATPANATQKNKKAPKMQKPATRAVRQSPAMKPQRQRKPPASTSIPAKDVAEIMEGFADNGSASGSRPGSANLRIPSQKTSEAGSTSPEPLSEVLMPPPATPRSAPKGRSPRLGPQNGVSSQQQQTGQGPATPATLMRLQNAKRSNAQTNTEVSKSDGKQSGPAPLRPNLSIEPKSSEDNLTTPTISARDESESAMATPRTVPASPSMTTSSKDGSKSNAKGKKRNSSSHPSPALRPKISPSIKPLLPEGASYAETSALLLASKSNYQNLLEGNTLPGVTYPNTLSANLTSKRTSHKLAEQGRRNRMNIALQELASLLPANSPTSAASSTSPSIPAMNDTSDPQSKNSGVQTSADKNGSSAAAKANAASKESSSKASTVEMAIDIIKSLQAELGATRGRLADVEQKLGTVESSISPAAGTSGSEEPMPNGEDSKAPS